MSQINLLNWKRYLSNKQHDGAENQLADIDMERNYVTVTLCILDAVYRKVHSERTELN